MIYKWSVTLPKLTGSERRNAYVYVPQACLDNPRLRLPVLYLFDGQNIFTDDEASFGKSWGMKDYLEFNDVPLIVAAVECSHDPEPDKCRLSEYAPFDYVDPTAGPIPGRGKLTMDWMTKVFKPMIDRRYPTLPGRKYTFIGGSSMGGLLSLYGLFRYNHVYSRAMALSPSLWTDPEQCKELVSFSRVRTDTQVYMDYGTEEMDNHPSMLDTFTDVTARLMGRGLAINARIVPGGTHSEESWENQLPFAVSSLLYGL